MRLRMVSRDGGREKQGLRLMSLEEAQTYMRARPSCLVCVCPCCAPAQVDYSPKWAKAEAERMASKDNASASAAGSGSTWE